MSLDNCHDLHIRYVLFCVDVTMLLVLSGHGLIMVWSWLGFAMVWLGL